MPSLSTRRPFWIFRATATRAGDLQRGLGELRGFVKIGLDRASGRYQDENGEVVELPAGVADFLVEQTGDVDVLYYLPGENWVLLQRDGKVLNGTCRDRDSIQGLADRLPGLSIQSSKEIRPEPTQPDNWPPGFTSQRPPRPLRRQTQAITVPPAVAARAPHGKRPNHRPYHDRWMDAAGDRDDPNGGNGGK